MLVRPLLSSFHRHSSDRRSQLPSLALLTSGIALLCLLGCSKPAPWNVLVITLDTTRADFLGCYGKESARTPNIDGLAAGGYLFWNHFSAVPVTTPSHSTIFTGTYPPFHGVRDNGLFSLPEVSTTLAEVLQDKGYATGAAIGAFPLTREYGLDQGFDFYEDHISVTAENYQGERTQEKDGLFFEERPAARVNDAILPWLREATEGPFFAWIHYWDPHFPHIPPEPFSQLYDYDLYQGEIAYADHSLGAILEELKKAGVYERTMIVITADHGEGRGEHDEDTHALLAYNATLRVPLVIKVPGREGGVRIDQRAGTVDILPTILNLLEMESPEEVQGRSLVPMMDGAQGQERRGLYYAETLSPRLSQGWGELRALYDGPYKLIYGPRSELYNLEADPTELHDLHAAEPDVAERMRSGLEGYLERVASQASMGAIHQASEESLQRLAALGYISAGGESPSEIQEHLRDDGEAPQDRVIDISLSSQTKQLIDNGKFLAAKERAARLMERDPDNAFYLSLLGMAYLGLGQPEEAAALVEEAENLSSRNDPIFLEVARQLFSAGDHERGQAVLQKILDGTESAAGQYLFGEMRAFLGDMEAFDTAMRRALELDPNHIRARSSLAIYLAQSGQPEEAEEHLRALLRKQPLNPRFQHNFGAFLLNTGRATEAGPYIQRAIELAPSYWRAYLSLISAQLAEGDGAAEETLAELREKCRNEDILEQARQLVEGAA